MRPRSRPLYALLLALTIICSLLSRSRDVALPQFVVAYAGDTLWALMVFLGFGFLFPKQSTRVVAALALVISFAVELSQMYHAPWLDAARRTRLGALALGQGFLWSNFVGYSIGVALGVCLEWAIQCRTR